MNLLRLIAARKPSVDPAQAFIDAAGITDSTQKSAIKQLVADLQSYGLWDKMIAIYPFVGGTSSTCKYNLKDPRDLDIAYRLNFSGGWTFSTNGALPDGTTGYADTFLNLRNVSGSTNNNHISIYSRTNNTTSGEDMGARSDSDTYITDIEVYWNGFRYYENNAGWAPVSVSSTNTLGFYVNSRLLSTTFKGYKNGTVELTITQNSTNSPNANLYLGATNRGGGYHFSNREIAFSSVGTGLTDSEAANFYTAVQTFQTTLGRQV